MSLAHYIKALAAKDQSSVLRTHRSQVVGEKPFLNVFLSPPHMVLALWYTHTSTHAHIYNKYMYKIWLAVEFSLLFFYTDPLLKAEFNDFFLSSLLVRDSLSISHAFAGGWICGCVFYLPPLACVWSPASLVHSDENNFATVAPTRTSLPMFFSRPFWLFFLY